MKMGDPKRMMIDIEDLVHWTYDTQKAQHADRSGFGSDGPKQFGSNWGAFERLLQLGHIGDGGSRGVQISDKVHIDALMVHDAVVRLPVDAFHLVYMHGVAGNRPDWYAHGAGAFEFVLDRRGRKKPIYRDPANRTDVIGYRQVFVGDRPEVVEHGRAQYTLWIEALRILCDEISDRLEEHHPQYPACDSTPWLDQNVKKTA